MRGLDLSTSLPIGLASNLTGVSASTIRAWERRYGVPTPKRSDNGRRSYDPHALNQIRIMSRLVGNGLPPSMAAKRILAGLPVAQPTGEETNTSEIDIPLEKLLKSVDGFDADGLSHQLRRLALSLPTHDFFDRVIVPLMARLNARWKNVRPVDRVQEYLTTETIRKLMHELCRMIKPGLPRGSVLITPFFNDVHVLPLDALSFLFNARGFRTLQLGPLTAPTALRDVIESTRPDLVAVSMTNRLPESDLRNLLEQYEDACQETPWIIGGSAARTAKPLIEKTSAILVPNGRALDRYLESFLV